MSLSISQEHIERVPGRCGGRPVIANTRIRVVDIYLHHVRGGLSPEEIIDTCYPELSLSDIYAALAYFYDHKEEILSNYENELRQFEELKRANGPSLTERAKAGQSPPKC